MKPNIDFNKEKSLLLKATRGVNSEDVIQAIKNNNVLDDLAHHNQSRYPNQRILVIKIKNYVYAVPYIENQTEQKMFLKTIYPSRVLADKYLKN